MDDKPRPWTSPDNERVHVSACADDRGRDLMPAAADIAGSTPTAAASRTRTMVSAALLAATALCSLGCSISDHSESLDGPSAPLSDDGTAGPSQEIGPNATVERVVDGDTIEADIGGRREHVRLLGIDAPETVSPTKPVQCYGPEAGAYLAQVLPAGTGITLVRDVEMRDQYDRLLAYVVRSDDLLFVNLDLVEKGYATALAWAPNTHYESHFAAAESQAESDGAGLWGFCGGPGVPLE